MSDYFACGRCRTPVRISLWAQRRSQTQHAAERCQRCGATHSLYRGSAECISDEVWSLNETRFARTPMSYSAWHIYRTRPYRSGYYHCRFSHIDGHITLFWTGTHFAPSSIDQRVINMRKFIGWRGVL